MRVHLLLEACLRMQLVELVAIEVFSNLPAKICERGFVGSQMCRKSLEKLRAASAAGIAILQEPVGDALHWPRQKMTIFRFPDGRDP